MIAASSDPEVAGYASSNPNQSRGLVHVSDLDPGIRRKPRRRIHRSISTTRAGGYATRRRCSGSSLAIPPAWTKVWICADPAGPHPGRRPRRAGRKQQYRYHPLWRAACATRRSIACWPSARRCRGCARGPTPTWRPPGLKREKVLAAAAAIAQTLDARRQPGIRARGKSWSPRPLLTARLAERRRRHRSVSRQERRGPPDRLPRSPAGQGAAQLRGAAGATTVPVRRRRRRSAQHRKPRRQRLYARP